MPGRKIKDEEEARASLQAVARTGLDLPVWCRAHEIDARSLGGWRGVLQERNELPEMRFVELIPVDGPAPTYRIHCGEFAVELAGELDEERLVRLLRVVARC